MDHQGLRALLVVHGCITLAAAIALTAAPGLIPGVVGIVLEPSAYVLVYLLAGAEFGFAVLSFGGSRLTDARALRLIASSCIAFSRIVRRTRGGCLCPGRERRNSGQCRCPGRHRRPVRLAVE
jgi:hypothetical protein